MRSGDWVAEDVSRCVSLTRLSVSQAAVAAAAKIWMAFLASRCSVVRGALPCTESTLQVLLMSRCLSYFSHSAGDFSVLASCMRLGSSTGVTSCSLSALEVPDINIVIVITRVFTITADVREPLRSLFSNATSLKAFFRGMDLTELLDNFSSWQYVENWPRSKTARDI